MPSSQPRQVLDDRQIDELVSLGCGRPLPAVGRIPVHAMVAEWARRYPERTAVRDGRTDLSYGELDAWAGRIAARLAAAGVRRGAHVGVLTPPSTDMVAAVLGVLRAGAAYVPVDLAQPDGRIGAVLADARAAAIVVAGDAGDRAAVLGLPLVRAEDAAGPSGETPPPVDLTGEDVAYLIYTSGSTGEPKGVLVEHAQLTASTLARWQVYSGKPTFLLVSPLCFDSSVAGLWGTLTDGGCLVVAGMDEVRDPGRLVEIIDGYAVTRLLCVPSLYGVLLDAAERLGPDRLRTLDTVIVAGEPLPDQLVDRHFAVHPGPVALVNEYGPTEATVWATFRRFEGPAPVSIGGPVPGVRLYVLDGRQRPVPRGTVGELFIGGAGVARGYFGRPDATGQVFVPDPFAPTGGARMYRTGDLVRWNDQGTLDFLGRSDHQVKIRGHRVELGAVEAALRAAPGVRDAVVVPDAARTRLIAFLLAEPGTDTAAVRAYLADRLPDALVPAGFRLVEKFPLTVNGKVDRMALTAVEPPPAVTPSRAVPATDAGGKLADQVTAAWAEVLSLSDVPRDVNFMDLGGHSLTMYKLQDALERHTGTRPSIVAMFRHTTVSAQAALIRDGGAQADDPADGMRQAAIERARALRARRQRANWEATR